MREGEEGGAEKEGGWRGRKREVGERGSKKERGRKVESGGGCGRKEKKSGRTLGI